MDACHFRQGFGHVKQYTHDKYNSLGNILIMIDKVRTDSSKWQMAGPCEGMKDSTQGNKKKKNEREITKRKGKHNHKISFFSFSFSLRVTYSNFVGN